MRKFLVFLILAVAIYAAETAHFYAVNSAGAPDSFVQSALDYLEEAYSAYASMGISLAQPCAGAKYLVNITLGSGSESGYAVWVYTYYQDTGYITSMCIRQIAIFYPAAQGDLLRPTVFHELAHVAQAAYVKYTAVVDGKWVVESQARAMEVKYGGGRCYDSFFSQSLYSRNPYTANGSAVYDYFPFFLWLFDLQPPSAVLQNAFSGRDLSWVNQRYVDYLKALAKGQSLCGQLMRPQYTDIDLSYGGKCQASVQLDGLSAKYYRVRVPRGAPLLIGLSGAASNLAVGQVFRPNNDTLLLAVANPSTSAASATLSITVAAELAVRLASATYYADSGTLEYEVNVVLRYSGVEMPVEGWIAVNGSRISLANGIGRSSLRVPGPGRYILNVTLPNATVLLAVDVAVPTIKAPARLYLTNSSRGVLRLEVENPGSAAFVAQLEVLAPNTSFNYTRSLALKPGKTALDVAFSVRGEPGNITYSMLAAPGKWHTAAKTVAVPLRVYARSAYFNGTHTRVALDCGIGNWTAAFPGLSGTVKVPYGGYVLAFVNISLPRPALYAEIVPDVVAPDWWNGTLRVVTHVTCPSYQASYEVWARVNNTSVSVMKLVCPDAPTTSMSIQFNTTRQRLTYVVDSAVDSSTASISPQYPQFNASLVALYITQKPYTLFNVSVAGPHRYLVAGRIVRGNSTVALRTDVGECAKEATLDLGFTAFRLELPAPSISLEAYNTLYPRPINATLRVRLPPRVYVNRTVVVYVNSTPLALRVASGGRYALSFEPKAPGTYVVSASLWCKSANATAYSVVVKSVRISADKSFALVGEPIRLELSEEWWPAQAPPPPINMTLSGCENQRFAMGSWVLGLRYDRQCTLKAEASAANATARVEVEVGCINIVPIVNPVDFVLSRPVLTERSQLRIEVKNCDGSPIPADTSIEWPKAYGSAEVVVRAAYRGRVNETRLHIAYAPDTYVKAMALAERLRHRAAWWLQAMAQRAALDGNWSAVAHIVEVAEGACGWPITEEAVLWPLSNYLETKSENWLHFAGLLSKYPYAIYVAIAAIASAVAVGLYRRRRQIRCTTAANQHSLSST